MGYDPIFQNQNKIAIPGGGYVEITVVGSLFKVFIFVPEEIEKEKEVEYQAGDLYYYAEMWIAYLIGAFWKYSHICSVYDIKNEKTATDIPLDDGSGFADFPCNPNLIYDWRYYHYTDSTIIPPLTPQPLFSYGACDNIPDWDNEGMFPAVENCDGSPYSSGRDLSCPSVNGAVQLFNDNSLYQCTSTLTSDPGYNSGFTTCCIFGASPCPGYSEGDFNKTATTDIKKWVNFSHGDMPNLAYSGQDFFYEYPRNNYILDFVYGFNGKACVYSSAELVLNNTENNISETRTWDIIEDSCRHGIVRHDEYNVTKVQKNQIKDYTQSVKYAITHTPLGDFLWPDSGQNISSVYQQTQEGYPVGYYGGITARSVSGSRYNHNLHVLVNPPKPGGLLWADGSPNEGGNCVFYSEYSNIIVINQMYGSKFYTVGKTAYSPQINEEYVGLPFTDPFTWESTIESRDIYNTQFYAATSLSEEDDYNGFLSQYDIHSQNRDIKFEIFMEELSLAAIYSAPWGGDPWDSNNIRTSPAANLFLKNQAVVIYPYEKKP